MNKPQNPNAAVATQTETYRAELDARRAAIERLMRQQEIIAHILAKLPSGLPLGLHDTGPRIQISGATREQVIAVMRTLGAGKWDRKPNPYHPEELDYETEIDGIEVILYGAKPPTSCQIVTEEIEVPAHKKIVKKLVCS